ncbi:MAG: arsenate reductase (glutaredoxin) [Actinomycetota bacterium]|nr:arsenate reductase (glutaredoxin) [Actinomycetota bacterium]
MDDVVIWTNPRCSKSRGAEELLAERGVVPRAVRYLDTPPSRDEIARVVALLGGDPRVLVRRGEPAYAELGLAAATPEQLLDALAAHPELLERPVVLRGDRAVVARPPERLLDLLD